MAKKICRKCGAPGAEKWLSLAGTTRRMIYVCESCAQQIQDSKTRPSYFIFCKAR